jgi:dinuclear metal center YbgI/SA1388 family protein
VARSSTPLRRQARLAEMPNLPEVARYLDDLLRTSEIPDYPNALNGVQLANRGRIRRVAAAVDFSSLTTRRAIESEAQLLLVHHGMFWGGVQPITGHVYERLVALVAADVAVYSSHLPLDLHPDVGNNALLARRLGLVPSDGFARYRTIDVGVSGVSDIDTNELIRAARAFAQEHDGSVVATPSVPGRRTRRWGICTGAGASSETLGEALSRGIDTLIVGEGPHHTAVQAGDAGLVIIYAGHYATETLGVKALSESVAKAFGIEAVFIEAPTGL